MDLITDICDEMIRCFKDRNFCFNFSTEYLYVDNENKGVYVHYEPLHKEAFLNYMESNLVFFDMHLPKERSRFLEEYMEFMENYCTKNRNTRYAVKLTVMYPRKIQTSKEKRAFVKEYVQSIGAMNTILPYYVENVRRGNGDYACITVIDRLYIGCKTWKIYKTSKYIDTRTGKFAAMDCPDQYRKQVCKAGDYVLDKNGDKIRSTAVFSNSLRIFCYAKDYHTKDNLWDSFIGRLRQLYINAVLTVCGKVKAVKNGKRLHKTINKPEYHRYVRRRIASMNYAKQVIEYTTNYLLNKACSQDIEYTPYNEGKNIRTKHSGAYKKIVAVFSKYKARFHKKSFHDSDGDVYVLDYYNQRVDVLEKNIRILLEQFLDEIKILSFIEERNDTYDYG